jgi:hypothetical protein
VTNTVLSLIAYRFLLEMGVHYLVAGVISWLV